MSELVEDRGSKSMGDLAREAMWFAAHTLIAVMVVVAVLIAFWAAKTPPEPVQPKLIATAIIILGGLVAGFGLAKVLRNQAAQYVWISGVLMFSIVCVYVLDLPTGNGLCNDCGAMDKLYRTFIDIYHPSGLMAGDGFLIGTWLPLSMVAYAIGAQLGLPKEEDVY